MAKPNPMEMFKQLQKEVAEAGTTQGLSDIEGAKTLILDFFFTQSEKDNKPVVDFTIEGGRHIRSGGTLVLESFTKVMDVLMEKKLTLESLLEDGYGLYARFDNKESNTGRGRFYWTVVLTLEELSQK